MLVKFKTNSYGDITMLGDVATKLLKMMGQSGEAPGAVMAADVANVRNTLIESLEKDEANNSAPNPAAAQNAEEGESAISNSTRAGPLLKLLEAAIESGDDVIWEK